MWETEGYSKIDRIAGLVEQEHIEEFKWSMWWLEVQNDCWKMEKLFPTNEQKDKGKWKQ